MKRLTTLLLSLFLLPLLTLEAGALTYTDYMKDLDNNTIKTYTNLQPVTTSSISPAVQKSVGQMAFTFASAGNPKATALYRVQGAETVTVAVYTFTGTFVAQVPGEPDTYAAGFTGNNMSYIQSQTLYPLVLGDNGMCYAQVGGRLRMLCYADSLYRLAPLDASYPTPNQTVGYGVNVYALTGSSQRQISLQRRTVTVTATYVYEELSGTVPAGTDSVMVEINDFSTMGILSGSGSIQYQKLQNGMSTVLKQVTFTGADLVMGVPEPPVIIDEGSSQTGNDDREEKSRSSSASSPRAASSSSTAGKSASSSSKSSSSGAKFEGEVTSVIPGTGTGKKSNSKGKGAASAAKSDSSQVEPSELPSYEEREPRVFELLPTGSRGGISPAVIVYILLMAGLLVLLLIKKR